MYKKIVTIGVFLLIALLGYSQKDLLLHIIKEGGTVSIFIGMLLVAITVFFPVVPFPVLAGVIGAVFGAPQGMVISLTGAMAGTMVFFFLSRYGFRDFAQEKLQRYPKVQEFEELLTRNSFIAVLTSRVIPVIPSPVVNLLCGLSHIKWYIFFVASTLGKIPNILILSFAGASFNQNKLFSFGLYGAYMLVIFIIYIVIVYRRMDKGSSD